MWRLDASPYQHTNNRIHWSFLWPLTHRAHALNNTIYIKHMLSTKYFGRRWCFDGQISEQILRLLCILLKWFLLCIYVIHKSIEIWVLFEHSSCNPYGNGTPASCCNFSKGHISQLEWLKSRVIYALVPKL